MLAKTSGLPKSMMSCSSLKTDKLALQSGASYVLGDPWGDVAVELARVYLAA